MWNVHGLRYRYDARVQEGAAGTFGVADVAGWWHVRNEKGTNYNRRMNTATQPIDAGRGGRVREY